MTSDANSSSRRHDPLFEHEGEMAARMRDFDWTATPLGPPDTWPSALRTYVHLMLTSRQPMYLAWTPDLIALYNDAYRPILGADKHPKALGTRTADIFGDDGYPGLKPVFDAALRGESAAFENLLVPLVRHGYLEEDYFDVSFSPVYVGTQVYGVFSSVTETTERVLSARRTKTLAALAATLLGAHDLAQIVQATLDLAQHNPTDLPCMLLYVPAISGEGQLADAVGWRDEDLAEWRTRPSTWLTEREARVVPITPVAAGPWPERVTHLVVLPLASSDEQAQLGVFAVGLNPRKHLDDAYHDFLQFFSAQLTSALRNAHLTEELRERNTDLAARNHALSAFEEWTRDLTFDLDADELIERAQALVSDLLPLDAAAYYEREGDRWFLKHLRGEYGNEDLRRAHEQCLPHATTDSMRIPFETGETFYQDAYDVSTDSLPEHTAHVSATVMMPLKTTRGVRGIFGLAVFSRSGWTTAERAIIETVGRSLSLALDRAEKIADLARERALLASANEELDAFAYSVSHDLRTPVRHIMGFNELLRKSFGAGLDAKATRYLQVVDDAAARMNTLIDAMLDLSRTSRLSLRWGIVDLRAIVSSVRAESQADVLERHVTWRVSALPLVTADHDLLRQVMVNLLSNALKYTRTREETVIEVWAEEREREWAVFVRDNGVGFDPRYTDKLFGVFQRLHRQEEFEGTGVGLANVRRIVQRHGGHVMAQSTTGQGATFGFTLPKHP